MLKTVRVIGCRSVRSPLHYCCTPVQIKQKPTDKGERTNKCNQYGETEGQSPTKPWQVPLSWKEGPTLGSTILETLSLTGMQCRKNVSQMAAAEHLETWGSQGRPHPLLYHSREAFGHPQWPSSGEGQATCESPTFSSLVENVSLRIPSTSQQCRQLRFSPLKALNESALRPTKSPSCKPPRSEFLPLQLFVLYPARNKDNFNTSHFEFVSFRVFIYQKIQFKIYQKYISIYKFR